MADDLVIGSNFKSGLQDGSRSDLNKLRILVVAPLPPWHKGGVERVVGETAVQLNGRKNVEAVIYCGDATSSKSCVWNGIRVRTYKTKEWRRYASSALLNAIRNDSKNFDIIHAHGSGTFIPLVAALAKGESKLVVSPHYHPHASRLSLSLLKLVYDTFFNAYALKKASRVICVSDTERKYVQRRFRVPASGLVTIPNGIDISRILGAKPYNLDHNVILSLGRLEKYKQHQLTIAAVKHLPARYRLYIIGRGSYQRTLQRLIQKYQLNERVKLLEACSDDQVYRLLKTCTVLVNLSEIEAFGITVLEALAAGKRVIVNNKLGLAELASRFEGAVFPVSNKTLGAVGLARLIEQVAAEPLYELDLRGFYWSNIAQRVLDVYNSVSYSNRSCG